MTREQLLGYLSVPVAVTFRSGLGVIVTKELYRLGARSAQRCHLQGPLRSGSGCLLLASIVLDEQVEPPSPEGAARPQRGERAAAQLQGRIKP